MEDVKVTRLINGPEAFTPDNEFCLGESEVARLLRRRRLLRPRAGRRGRDGQGDGRVDRRRRAGDGPVGDGHPALRRRTTARRRYTLKRTREVYETYYDISTPATSARPAARCGSRAPTPGTASTARRSARSRAGSASTGTSPTRPRATRRCARAAGRAGCWSPAIGAEHVACRERAALFDESSFAKLEVAGPGAAAFLERLCDNRVARDVGQITYTQMLNRRGGIECDFTVTRVEEELFSIVTGTAFGNHDLVVDPPPRAATTASVRVSDVTSRWACFALWGPRARDDPRAADARPARLRLHDDARARRRRRAGARAARDVRRRAGLGALLPDRVRRRAVARAVGGGRAARARRRRLPRDRLAAPGEGLPRVGGRHHARRDARSRRGSASASSDDKDFIGARRARASRDAAPSACAASCSTTRARSRSATSRCASAARSSGA